MARRVMEQLVQYGEVRRGQIGISVRDLAADLAARESYQGALIAEIANGSPAEKAAAEGRHRKGGRWHADQKRVPASQFNRPHPARRARRASVRT
jgi:S1-C subfamily serine protease